MVLKTKPKRFLFYKLASADSAFTASFASRWLVAINETINILYIKRFKEFILQLSAIIS